MATPSAGWRIHGFDYSQEGWKRAASIFLAQSADGSQRSVQFWLGDNPPTAYHGHWEERRYDSSILVQFNGRGLGEYEFEGVKYQRHLHNTLVHRVDGKPGVFKGKDYLKRKITMAYDRTWTVTADSAFDVKLDVDEGPGAAADAN